MPRRSNAPTFSTKTKRGRSSRTIRENSDQSPLLAPASPPPVAGIADVLARESAGDKVDGGEIVRSDFSDVSELGDAWPMLCEDSLAEVVDFDLPRARPSSAFEAEGDASDAREQRTEGRPATLCIIADRVLIFSVLTHH